MTFTILRGDCIDKMRTLPDESVQCVVTSPPYFGLRDYNIPPIIWGGARDCQHEWGGAACCLRCDAWCGSHGLEPTIARYLDNAALVFREVWRVLRNDGTMFINIGDSYNAAGRTGHGTRLGHKQNSNRASASGADHTRANDPTFKPKDRMMMPARVAIALQDDGWTLRDEIVWHKLNPMPTSARDRTTLAHEMIYMFSKSEHYFYDADAIREPASDNTHARAGKIKAPDGWDTGKGGHGSFHRSGREKGKIVERLPGVTPKSAPENSLIRAKESWHASTVGVLSTRNKRSVWSIATEPSTDDSKHYAAYPTALIIPMIKAGTSEVGCCAQCGAPWRRITERGETNNPRRSGTNNASHVPNASPHTTMRERAGHVIQTTGWSPGCACGAAAVPCTVLDPFIGSGTTALVCDRLGRDCIGIELSNEYADYAERRVREDVGPLLAAMTSAPAEQLTMFTEAAE